MSDTSSWKLVRGSQPSCAARLGRVADQLLDLGGPKEARVDARRGPPDRGPTCSNATSTSSRTVCFSPVAIT